jgi:glycosyltransferase involved in cell wall biosynthesis
MKINILLFWFVGYDLGEGRTYQKVAEHLAEMPEVARVAVIFPPNKIQEGMYAKPLTIKKTSKKLIIIKENAPILPLLKSPYRLRIWINNIIRTNSLKSYLRFLGYKKNNTILWLFPPHPYLEEIAQRIPHTLLVAHIVDNFEISDDKWLRKYAIAQYPRIRQNADVIITGSKFNQKIFSAGRKRCYLFENAVDDMFISEPARLPHLERGTRPRLGYVGTLSERTDINLMEYLARKKPKWLISIVGHQHIPDSELRCLFELPNVEYYGHIPYEEVPRFLKTLDVCLITHKNTEYCQSMSPLKLFQYMASGRPIVASNVAGLDNFKDYIEVAETYEEFMRCVEHILKNDTIEKSKARIDIVRGETWARRIQEIFKLVTDRFNEKPYDKAPVKEDGFAHSLK